MNPEIMLITSSIAVVCIMINIFVLGHGTDGDCPHSHSHGNHHDHDHQLEYKHECDDSINNDNCLLSIQHDCSRNNQQIPLQGQDLNQDILINLKLIQDGSEDKSSKRKRNDKKCCIKDNLLLQDDDPLKISQSYSTNQTSDCSHQNHDDLILNHQHAESHGTIHKHKHHKEHEHIAHLHQHNHSHCDHTEQNHVDALNSDVIQFDNNHLSHEHEHGHNDNNPKDNNGNDNINLSAAIVHLIGDAIQSLGAFLASIIIYFQPSQKILDPVLTLLFAIVVIVTTYSILIKIINELMEISPFDLQTFKDKVMRNKHIIDIHHIRAHTLGQQENQISLHVIVDQEYKHKVNKIQTLINAYAHQFNVNVTIQIEFYDDKSMNLNYFNDSDENKCLISQMNDRKFK